MERADAKRADEEKAAMEKAAMKRAEAITKANNAMATRGNKAKLRLYDLVDAPVVQSYLDMLKEDDQASSETPKPERGLKYIQREHPQVYLHYGTCCTGQEIREFVLHHDHQWFWFGACLRCACQRRDLPPDHDWKNCTLTCFFCLSLGHVGEPCPGPLRCSVEGVRQVMALEAPGLDWYERMTKRQVPDTATILGMMFQQVSNGLNNQKKTEVVSLLSSSSSSEGSGQGDVRDEPNSAAQAEEQIEREDQPQPHDLGDAHSHNDAGQQAHGVIPLPSHGGKNWSTEEMVAYYANQRDMAAYETDSEDEDDYQEDDGSSHCEELAEFQAQPYDTGSHWANYNDPGQQIPATAPHLLSPSSLDDFGVERAVMELGDFIQSGSQEQCPIDLTSDGPGSPQALGVADQRECAENEYDADSEEESLDGYTGVEGDEEAGFLVDEVEEDEETDFLMDEDDEESDMQADEEEDAEMDEDEENAGANEDDSDGAKVLDLTSSSPPPENNHPQRHTIESQSVPQDEDNASPLNQDLPERAGSQPPADAFDHLPTAAQGNQETTPASDDIPSSDTVMADDSNTINSSPIQSNLGARVRDSLSPVRSGALFLSTTFPNMRTGVTDHVEPGEQETFASARDSMTLYRSTFSRRSTAAMAPPGHAFAQNPALVSGLQPNQDTPQPAASGSGQQETHSTTFEAPSNPVLPSYGMNSEDDLESDARTRENTPLSSTDLIQLQREVERQRAMAREYRRQHLQVEPIDGSDAAALTHGASGTQNGSAPVSDMDAIQQQLQRDHEAVDAEIQQFQHLTDQTSTAAAVDRAPRPSPTPTELDEQQQAIDFAQAYLRHPSPPADSDNDNDEEEEEQKPQPSLKSCLKYIPCGPPPLGQANHAAVAAAPDFDSEDDVEPWEYEGSVTDRSWSPRSCEDADDAGESDEMPYAVEEQPHEGAPLAMDVCAADTNDQKANIATASASSSAEAAHDGQQRGRGERRGGEARARTRSHSPEQGLAASDGASKYRQR